MDVHAGLALTCSTQVSSVAEFVWRDEETSLSLGVHREALREFVRQASAILAAMDKFKTQEDSGEDPGDFHIKPGEDGQTRTAEERDEACERHHVLSKMGLTSGPEDPPCPLHA